MLEFNEKSTTKLNLQGIFLGNPIAVPQKVMSNMGLYAYDLGLVDFQERGDIENEIMSGNFNIMNMNMKAAKENYDNIKKKILAYSGLKDIENFRNLKEDPYKPKFNMTKFFEDKDRKDQFKLDRSASYKDFSQITSDLIDDFFMRDGPAQKLENVILRAQNDKLKFKVVIYSG